MEEVSGFAICSMSLTRHARPNKPISGIQSHGPILVLGRRNGFLGRNDIALARYLAGSSLDIEPARIPPAFTLRDYRWDCILIAWRNTGGCWRGLEPSPQLGMGVSCGHYCNAGFGKPRERRKR